MKKAIIFGANGQDGFYLTKLLNSLEIQVLAVSRTDGFIKGDICDFNFVEKLVKESTPDFVFNFAANSSTSHEVIFENHSTIASGTLNILEAVKRHSINTKIFISGSALQFENHAKPIDENSKFDASSHYSAARIYSVYLSRYYRKKFGLKVYVGYLFNHDSPLRRTNHFNQKVVFGIGEILSGKKKYLDLGNLSIEKEFGFSGDIVEAIWILVNQTEYYEVVIGTGKAYKLKDWVEKCFSKVGLDWKSYVKYIDEPTIETGLLVSKPDLILKMGWMPKYDIDDLVNLMIP